MKRNIDRHYGLFCELMTEEHIYYDETLGFKDLCRMIGANPWSLDSTIRSELGMDGQKYMSMLRAQTPERLYKKYAVKIGLYCKNHYIVGLKS